MAGPHVERTDPPLVGREHELAAGFELVEAIRRGRPALLELVGEGGIGKSALAAAVAGRAADRGARVLRARAAAFERDVPYALWIALLDEPAEALPPQALDALGPERLRELTRLLPGLATAAPGAPAGDAASTSSEARFRLHRALGALVAALAARGPLVLVLDDLHWADAGSLELALHLLRQPPRAGVLLVAASRPGPAAAALAEAGRDLPDRRQLQLGPLPDAAARALLQQADGADELLARAHGNPFFLLELARARRDGGAVPRSVLAAVEATVEALPRAARVLLEGGALAGDPFELRLAEAAGGLSEGAAAGAVDALLDARLLELDGSDLRCRFRHPLVREAVHERIAVERRRVGHAALARALAARGADARAVAPHLVISAQPGDEQAITRLEEAAGAAHATAPETAARWLEAAERLLPAEAGERRLGLRLRRSLALAASGRIEAAHDVLLAVHDDLPPASPLATPTVVQLAQIERELGRAADSRARLERALAQAPADPAQEAELRLALAFTLVQLAARDAGAAVGAALAAAEAAGSRYAIASARALASMAASWAGDHAAAAALVDAALAELALVADEELMRGLETTYTLGLVAIAHERFAEADALLERGATLARRSGQDHALAALLTFRGMSGWNLGALERSLELVDEAVQLARLLSADRLLGHALALSCHLRVAAGEREAAARDGDEALRVLALQQADVVALTSRFNVALFRSADADPARALREATAIAGPELAPIDPAWSCQVAGELVRCALRIEDLAQARRWAALAGARADHLGLPLARANAAAAEALVLTAEARGGASDAVATARRALELAEPLGLPPHTAATRAVLGEALAAAGASEAAAAELQAAADGFAACGMRRAHAVAARAIRRLGGRVAGRVERPVAARRDALAELTGREREIARLVAAGAANKEIGAALHLSQKTVANHLTRIYAKLGLRHRTELATLAAGDDR